MVASILLTGCDQADDSSSVVTISGDNINLTGTWETLCFNTDSIWDYQDKIQQQIYTSSKNSITLKDNIYNFDSSDGSCSNPTHTSIFTHEIEITNTTAFISGWGSSIAPLTQNQSGDRISYTAEFTPLTFILTTINGSPVNSGVTANSGFVVDDTGLTPVMYKIQEIGQYYGMTENPYYKKF